MAHDNIDQLITAYADREITDPSESSEIKNLIEKDEGLKFDYRVQLLMKTIISEKLKIKPVPGRIKNKIIRKINPSKKILFLPDIFFAKPIIAFSSAAIIILAILLLIFNRTPQIPAEDFSAEQSGNDNMYIQARKNFRSILEGELTPQLISNNPEEIKSFFKKKGVNYKTYVPEYDKWTLLGAVVSVDNGEKFAHHVYAGKEDKLIYLFQVDEDYLEKHKILKLSEELIEYLNDGNCLNTYEDGLYTLMTKSGDNIVAVVSNIPSAELKEEFCNLN